MSAAEIKTDRLSDGSRPSLEGWTKCHHPADGTDSIQVPSVPVVYAPDGMPLTFELNLMDWNGDPCPIPDYLLDLMMEAPTLRARATAFLSAARETRILLNAARRESRHKDYAITEAVTLLRELGRRGAFDARADNSFTRFIWKHGGTR